MTPSIVGDELFAGAQAGLRSRSKSKGTAKSNGLRPYLPRGRIICHECGAKMYLMSERRHHRIAARRAAPPCANSRDVV